MTASVLAVVLAGAAVGTAEAMIVPHGGPSAPVVGGTPSAGRHSALPSPGVGMRHYAPRARLILIEGSQTELPARLAEAAGVGTAHPPVRVQAASAT